MQRLAQLREVVPAERVPVAVPVGPAQALRHGREHPQIARRGLQQRRVVLHRRGDERIVVWVLVLLRVFAVLYVLPVYEQPLDPPVTNPAGVAGDVHPLWYVVHASQQPAEELEGPPCKLRGLVEENPVVLLPVVLQLAGLARPVPEVDDAAVDEIDGVQRAVVGGQLRPEQLYHRLDVVRLQLRIGLAHYQYPDARIVVRAEHGLCAHGPGLAPALGPSVARVELARGEEKLLLWVCLARIPLVNGAHSAAPLPTPLSSITSFCSLDA